MGNGCSFQIKRPVFQGGLVWFTPTKEREKNTENLIGLTTFTIHRLLEKLNMWQQELLMRRFSTDPDILRLMVNCSHMSDASNVSWGPTKLSSCSQKSLVISTDAEKRRRGEDRHYGPWAEDSNAMAQDSIISKEKVLWLINNEKGTPTATFQWVGDRVPTYHWSWNKLQHSSPGKQQICLGKMQNQGHTG